MTITECRCTLVNDGRMLALASVVFDHCFVINSMRVIDGSKGLFVAMPDRPLTDNCPRCRCRNSILSNYCNRCGDILPKKPLPLTPSGGVQATIDVCYPITQVMRKLLEKTVLETYRSKMAAVCYESDPLERAERSVT